MGEEKKVVPLFKVSMHCEVAGAVQEVLDSGYIGQGEAVDRFERRLQDALGLEEPPLTVNSCTSALDLAYHLIGIGPGDEVISTPVTCTATNTPLVNRGAQIVWADVDPETGLIEPKDVESKVSRKTKAIVACDWGGRRCDYKSLRGLGVPVVQDAAHSFGPQPGVGGDYRAWSFQAIKFLTCGDGGALVTPPEQTERARLLRWYGLDRRSNSSFRCAQKIEEAGYKYHMNDIAATIGIGNIGLAQHAVTASQINAQKLWEADFTRAYMPRYDDDCCYWLCTLLSLEREAVMRDLLQEGINCSEVHARNDRHPGIPGLWAGELPGVDDFSSRQFNVPVGHWVGGDDIKRIVRVLR